MSLVEDAPISLTGAETIGDMAGDAGARRFIAALLMSPDCPAYSMNPDQLDGYLRAVAAEPKPTDIKDWMPLVFGGELPGFISGYPIDMITNALISLYNSHRAQVLNNQCTLSFPYEYAEDRASRIQAEQWARGFMQGYIFWQDIWSQYLDENQTGSNLAVILPISTNDEIDDILATISAVADANYALQTGVTIPDLTQMFNRLPQKVIEYGRIAHIIRSNSYAEACERATP
ncbi:hypothetical protein GCM10011613_13970 [Cellvibrio zantedeschiae]|uniref:YecA family protein n=1 Tax=Cellvibrio zantedeschiae TaxID=1237077 RepID=A0ABQ3AX97_9GAMM|nr:YecA family protein [Cellvibrio zantedeschiae]GGY70674.1 hypothetical protein GCM10011613_13970 [Cellvibrio zantedeschiae]